MYHALVNRNINAVLLWSAVRKEASFARLSSADAFQFLSYTQARDTINCSSRLRRAFSISTSPYNFYSADGRKAPFQTLGRSKNIRRRFCRLVLACRICCLCFWPFRVAAAAALIRALRCTSAAWRCVGRPLMRTRIRRMPAGRDTDRVNFLSRLERRGRMAAGARAHVYVRACSTCRCRRGKLPCSRWSIACVITCGRCRF